MRPLYELLPCKLALKLASGIVYGLLRSVRSVYCAGTMRQGYWPHHCEEHVRQGRRWQKRYANLTSVLKQLEEAIPALSCFMTAHKAVRGYSTLR